jgi:hypothetical protein
MRLSTIMPTGTLRRLMPNILKSPTGAFARRARSQVEEPEDDEDEDEREQRDDADADQIEGFHRGGDYSRKLGRKGQSETSVPIRVASG